MKEKKKEVDSTINKEERKQGLSSLINEESEQKRMKAIKNPEFCMADLENWSEDLEEKEEYNWFIT